MYKVLIALGKEGGRLEREQSGSQEERVGSTEPGVLLGLLGAGHPMLPKDSLCVSHFSVTIST